jgi:hypothetical protein
MTRYILIDRNSGFIWEEADAKNAAEACRIVDERIDPQVIPYEYEETHGQDASATYDVYRAPEGFREITDGQDPEQIFAVESQCEYVTTVARTGGDMVDENEEVFGQ